MQRFPILMLALLVVVLSTDAKPATTATKSQVKAAPVKTDSKDASKAKSTVASGKATQGASKSNAAAPNAAKSGATKPGSSKSAAPKASATATSTAKTSTANTNSAKTSIVKQIGAIKVNAAEVAMPANGVFSRPSPTQGSSPFPDSLPAFPAPNFLQAGGSNPFQAPDLGNLGENTVQTLLSDGSTAYVLGGFPSIPLNVPNGFGGGGFSSTIDSGLVPLNGGAMGGSWDGGLVSVQQDTQSDGIISGQVIGAIDPVKGGAMGFQPGNGWSMG